MHCSFFKLLHITLQSTYYKALSCESIIQRFLVVHNLYSRICHAVFLETINDDDDVVLAVVNESILLPNWSPVLLDSCAYVRCRVSASKIHIGFGRFLVLKCQSTAVFRL